MPIQPVFGEVLKKARNLQAVTQEELAYKSRCSSVYISELERGVKDPSLEMVIKLSLGLRMHTHEFVEMLEQEGIERSFQK